MGDVQPALFEVPDLDPEPAGVDLVTAHHSDLLVTTLCVAVPMWIARADDWGPERRPDRLACWRAEALAATSEHGDVILYTGKQRGETARAFNALARGIAAMACHRGGVVVFGLVWCAEHSPGGAVPTVPTCCARCLEQYPDAPKGCPCCAGDGPSRRTKAAKS
jgi:hypothetical protein